MRTTFLLYCAAIVLPLSYAASSLPSIDQAEVAQSKAATIIISRAVFTNATLEEAMNFIKNMSRDTRYSVDPGGVRVEFVGPASVMQRTMSFRLERPSLAGLAQAVATATNLKVRCIDDRIIFTAK